MGAEERRTRGYQPIHIGWGKDDSLDRFHSKMNELSAYSYSWIYKYPSIAARRPIHGVEDDDGDYHKENGHSAPESVSPVHGLVDHNHLISTHSIIIDDDLLIRPIPEPPIVFDNRHSVVRTVWARPSVVYDDLFSGRSETIVLHDDHLILTTTEPPIVIHDDFFPASKHSPVFFDDDSIVAAGSIPCSVASVHQIMYELYWIYQ